MGNMREVEIMDVDAIAVNEEVTVNVKVATVGGPESV